MSFVAAFLSSLKREWRWLKSSFWNWGVISIIPLLVCLFCWAIFSLQAPNKLPIGVLNQDNSSFSRQIIRHLEASPGLHIAQQYYDPLEAKQAFQRGDIYGIVIIPEDTTQAVKSQKQATIVLHHNAQFGTHSPLIQKDVRTVIGTISAGIKVAAKNKTGTPIHIAKETFNPLQNVVITLFNANPDYQIFIASTAIIAVLHIIAMMFGAYIFGRELRDQTLSQWLSNINLKHVNPKILLGAILGKITPTFVGFSTIGFIMLLIFVAAMPAAFSSVLFTYIALMLFILLSILVGAFYATLTISLRKGLSISGFISAPAYVFSGIGFPIHAMPYLASLWATVLPLTHYLKLQVNQLQMGAPYSRTLPIIFAFIIFSGLFFVGLYFMLIRALSKPQRWGAR